MLRFLAVLAFLCLAAMQVAFATPTLRLDEEEPKRDTELLERILAEMDEEELLTRHTGSAHSIVGKPTEQSTTLNAYTSAKAVDGSQSTVMYPDAHCSHTSENAMNPWWRVDLETEHCISKVTILNRGDCCSERLANAVVRAGTSTTITGNPVCGSPVSPAQARPRGGTIVFECAQPLRARYVSVDIPGSATLQLCEVTVEDVPLSHCQAPQPLPIVGETTQQSTTMGAYSSDKAVDGSQSAIMYPDAKCSHTDENSDHPWWGVILGHEHCISRVTILNRGDCCSERLKNAVVRAGTSDRITQNPICGSPVTADQAAPLGGTIVIACAQPLKASIISVDIPGKATLQLCEVTVEQISMDQCPGQQSLSIVGKPTQQSSTYGSLTSDKAVDGSQSSSMHNPGSCIHTAEHSMNPWWRVDLGGEHCINKVKILNRGDCCSGNLKNAVVRVGTSTTATDNASCGSPVTADQAAPLGGTVVFECAVPLRGRYVSVDIPGSAILELCEVEVEEIVPGMC